MATIEGVVREPSALAITSGLPEAVNATQEFVVPRSIPMTCPIGALCLPGNLNRESLFLGRPIPDWVRCPSLRRRQ